MNRDKMALTQAFSRMMLINAMQSALIDDLFSRLSQHVAVEELEEIAEAVRDIVENM